MSALFLLLDCIQISLMEITSRKLYEAAEAYRKECLSKHTGHMITTKSNALVRFTPVLTDETVFQIIVYIESLSDGLKTLHPLWVCCVGRHVDSRLKSKRCTTWSTGTPKWKDLLSMYGWGLISVYAPKKPQELFVFGE